MIHRILIGTLALLTLAASSFALYGWSTRQGAPEFSQGGAFASPTPTTTTGGRVEHAGSSPGEPARAARAERAQQRPPASRATAPVGPAHAIDTPDPGTYRYAASGTEEVRFGPTSACSWDIEDVTAVVKHRPAGVVFDWTYASQHQQRHVMDYRTGRVMLTYAGAAVTCVGVRQTTDDTYDPPAIWVQRPWDVGARWEQRVVAGERIEDTVARVVAKERVTVGAGRFLAYRIESTTTFSGNSEGTHSSTTWFAPALGMNVKRIADTDARRGSAHYTSHVELELASRP